MQDNDSYQLSLDLPSESPSWSKQVCRAKRSMRCCSDSPLDMVPPVKRSNNKYRTGSRAMPKRKKALAASKAVPLTVVVGKNDSSGHSRESVATKSTSGKSFDSMPINLRRQAKKLHDSINSLSQLEFTNELRAFPITETPNAVSSVPSKHDTSPHRDKFATSPASIRSPAKFEFPSEIKFFPTTEVLETPDATSALASNQAASRTRIFETEQASDMKQQPDQSQNSSQRSNSQCCNKQEMEHTSRSPSCPYAEKQGLSKLSFHPSRTENSCHESPPDEIDVGILGETSSTIEPSEATSHASGSQKRSALKNSCCCCSATSGSGSLKRSSIEHLDAVERFISHERSLKDQIESLTPRERNCFFMLRQSWDTDHRPLSGHMYLRFARFCRFDIRQGRKLLSKVNERYLNLTATLLEPQLLTQTLFPLPGLKDKSGLDMFYMRPALYFPQLTKTQTIIDNLAYVMLTMVEKEQASIRGVGFLAYMNDWTMDNFCVDYCLQFMKMLQGGVPARVGLFLIVNPPSWFGAIWKIMEPMLHPNFRRKVKIIPEKMLPKFLAPGYQAYMPCDTHVGTCNTTQLVKDFVAYRKHVEEKTGKQRSF